ncbi:CGNR zinc finger domain-containing protein [Agilicoccus flavus]|uniref:CGNR zinc finger domain-containing protein n=1 Tax=Agilicoccus flavus TaxID=2775968 RepID=UPI001CF676B1|nr:CGNR zinc finger domain-containing protein [Agilicoccus flavus]
MAFAHDAEVSLQMAAALVNALAEPDTLRNRADLDDFVDTWQFTGRRDRDEAELDEVRALARRLHALWRAPEDELVAGVNDLLREAGALPQVVRHDHWGWHLHATNPDRPLAERIAVEAAMAFVDVLRSDETNRLRTCAADGCEGVLIDLSRNRSRRFCSAACGNRVAAAAYRARRAGD